MDNNLKQTLTKFRKAYDNKVAIELDKKANVDGNYPTMTVGNADALTPYGENSGANDTTPFVFQSTGGSSDVGSKAYLKALRGNSVAFNQLALALNSTNYYDESGQRTFNTTNNSCTYTADGTETAGYRFRLYSSSANIFKRYSGHKYLITFKSVINTSVTVDKYRFVFLGQNHNETFYTDGLNNWLIATPQYTDDGRFTLTINLSGTATSGDTWTISNLMIIDLTLMFGAGNEPTTVLEFNRLFPLLYYVYNAGTLLSCKVNGIKNVGYNAFDGIIESNIINSQGQNDIGGQSCRSKNYIKVIAGQTYTFSADDVSLSSGDYLIICEYDENQNFIQGTFNSYATIPQTFVLSNNTHYVRWALRKGGSNWGTNPPTQDTVKIAFHLTWDSARTGYEEHEEWQYNLPNIELRSAGSAYDELKPDGTLIRRIGVVDLGTQSWSSASYGWYITLDDIKPVSSLYTKGNIICSKYPVGTSNQVNIGGIYGIALDQNKHIQVRDSALSGMTAQQVASALSGVMLYYELAEYVETQDDNYKYQEIQDIDDFGTQEFLYDNDIDIPVPQGNEFFYPVNYKAFIDSFGGREDIEYDPSQIVSQEELGVVSGRIPALPADAEDGTYTLKATKSGSSINYSWVADE